MSGKYLSKNKPIKHFTLSNFFYNVWEFYITCYLSIKLRSFWNRGFVDFHCVMTCSMVNRTQSKWISIKSNQTQSNAIHDMDWVQLSLAFQENRTSKKLTLDNWTKSNIWFLNPWLLVLKSNSIKLLGLTEFDFVSFNYWLCHTQ